MPTYGDDFRRFLQSFIANPCQSEDLAKKNYALCYEEMKGRPADNVDIDAVIGVINEKLASRCVFEVRNRKCEVTGDKYYVFMSKIEFSWSKNVSPYTEAEQNLLTKIFEEILKSDNGFLNTISLFNMTHRFTPPLSKSVAEQMLQKFVHDQRLINKSGQLFISARSALEFETNFSQVQEVEKCFLCKSSSYYGFHCSKCDERVHEPCLFRYFSLLKGARRCPKCREIWEGEPFAESSLGSSEALASPSRRK